MEKMKELFEKVSKDVTLQEKFSAIMKDAEIAGEDEMKKKLSAFAIDEGYDIPIEEMQAFFKEIIEKDQGELSDVELDMVAGGKGVIGGEMIALSILSIGTMCALVSVAAEVATAGGGCGELFRA